MRKSTKRLVSGILALSMLVTSMTVNPASVFAADYTSGSLEGYSFTSSTEASVKTSTWTFNSTDEADVTDKKTKEVTVKGNEDPKIAVGDTFDGITVTGEGTKSWNSGNQFSLSKTMGFDVALSSECTGGKITVTCKDTKDTRYLIVNNNETKKVAYSKAAPVEFEFTADDINNGVLSFSNSKSDGDYKILGITLVENLGAAADTTTVEATTEETTVEATTAAVEDSTTTAAEDTTTEPTTAADVNIGSSYKAVFGDSSKVSWATGDAAYKKGNAIEVDPSVEVIAAQELDYTLKNPAEVNAFENGNVYDSHIASTGANTSVSVDGADPVNYRIALTIKALKDVSIAIDSKVGAGKTVILGKTDDPIDAIVNVTSIDTVASNSGELHTFATDLKEGETVVFLGLGTNPPIYGIDAVAEGEDPAGDAEWDVVFEDLIKDLATGDPFVKKAGSVIFDNDEMTVTNLQELDASKEEESVFGTSGNTYTRWVASIGDSVEVAVDGEAPSKYRKVIAVEAKQNGTLSLDLKFSASATNKKAIVVATGNDTDGYTSLPDGIVGTITADEIPADVTDFHTFELSVNKGDVITVLGRGTNPPLFGVNFEAEGEIELDGLTVLVAQDEVGDYDIAADKTSESISFYVKNNPGFNNFTVFVKYDPTLIKATSGQWGDLLANVDGFKENADQINTQIANVPKANNSDYTEVGADGVKTQAELGLIKIAGFSKDAASDYIVSGDGCLFTIDFDILQKVEKKTNTGIEFIIVQDGFRPELGSSDIIETEVMNEVYLVPEEVTTTTESTTESTTDETETATETETESDNETTTADVTTEATTQEVTEAVETTTAAADVTTEATTEAESVSVETTIVIVTRRTSSGGGGGGSSSSLTKSSTTTTESSVEPTTSSRSTYVGDGKSFVVVGKNGQDVVINPPTATKSVNEFVDVPASHWAHDSIMKLAELGIVNGVGDNMYAPSAPCKRADFIIMINNTLGITGTAKFNFSDVAANKYYYNPVGVAYEVGIASGYGDDTFKPENYCTREEMMVLVAKTFEFLGETVTTTSQDNLSVFADRDEISWWAAPYTAYLVDKGMVVGTGANFEPKVYMNRAQLAVLIAQVYDQVVAMAAERGVSAEEVVDEIVEEASSDETTAVADVVKLAAHVKADVDEIDADYYKDLKDDIKKNYDARKAEFEELYATISEDMSEEDAAKANVSLKEFDELFEDIIAEAE